MSHTKPSRSWDDRRSPEDHRSRKRKNDVDHYKDRENNRARREHHHRDLNYNQRHKTFENNKHHDAERQRDDDKPRQRNEARRSRFSQPFIKKESSPEWGKPQVKDETNRTPQEKEKPNFQTSGKLTEERNTVHGVVIKYAEPPEARMPKRRWRLYPFKGEKSLPVLYIHRQSAYLMGRDRKIADIPLDHPSCSKQHAALQYRLVTYKRANGSEGKQIRPYIIDLESANGTFVNNVKLEAKRYHELLERDVIKFGFSSREYVVLHEQSKDEEQDDDVNET